MVAHAGCDDSSCTTSLAFVHLAVADEREPGGWLDLPQPFKQLCLVCDQLAFPALGGLESLDLGSVQRVESPLECRDGLVGGPERLDARGPTRTHL
jgi:hypothetical protein